MKFVKIFLIVISLLCFRIIWAQSPVDQALEKKLYNNVQWIKLLHYDFNNGLYKSRSIESSKFFFSNNGRINPRDELVATLEHFLHSPKSGDEHPACLFPARYKWLRKELGNQVLNFNFDQCKKYNTYTDALATKSVSIVFVSSMMQVPASMFGHTFLKLNAENGKSVYDDFTISFVADVKAKWFMDYAIKGMTGGFDGVLDFQPFDYRVKYYNYHENRSMWEFKLKFNSEETERLTDHLWEIRSADIKYYFMSENCAFFNAYFLEVAKPDLAILKKSDIFVYPTETIKNIINNTDILEGAYYYPANILNYETGYNLLNIENKLLLSKWMQGNFIFPENKKQSIILLNTARYRALIDAYDDKSMQIKGEKSKVIQEAEEVMKSRQIIPITFAQPDFTNPSIGHRPAMVSTLFGHSSIDYLDLIIRPVYHDRYDSPLGYPPYSEISGLKTTLRLDLTSQKPYLQRFDLISLLSISPITAELFNYSMKISSWIDLPDNKTPGFANADTYSFNFDNGYGLSFKLPFPRSEFVWYLMANYTINLSHAFLNDYRLTTYAETGFFWYPFDWLTVHMNMQYGYYIPYDTFFWQAAGGVNVLFNENLSAIFLANYDFINPLFSYEAGLRIYF